METEMEALAKMEATIENIRRNVREIANILCIDLDEEDPEPTDEEKVDRRELDWAETEAVDRDMTQREMTR